MNQTKMAIYFDNEHHVINYSVSLSGETIILTSQKIDNTPVFRLIYSSMDEKHIRVKFETSQDGLNFRTYLEGKSKKTDV